MANETSAILRTVPDVQSGLPATQVSLSRVGVTGVEKVIRVRDADRENLFYAEMECFVDLEPKQAGVHMSRFEEIVGEAIDEVVLGEAFKAEVLAAHVAEKVRERQHGRRAEVSLTARYPEIVADPGEPDRHPGDLRAVRDRGRLRGGDADADRRPGAGNDRLPVRPGDGHRALPRTARRAGLRRRADREDRRRGADRDPQPARHRHPPRRLPRGRPGLDRRARPAADRRELDELGDLRADEAPRRDGGGRQSPRNAALRRGLRAGDDPPGGRGLPRPARRRLRDGAPGEPGDDPPPQRGGGALRHPRRAASGADQRRTLRRTTSRCASGSRRRSPSGRESQVGSSGEGRG